MNRRNTLLCVAAIVFGLFLIATGLTSCEDEATNPAPNPPRPIEFSTLEHYTDGPFRVQTHLMIGSREEWIREIGWLGIQLLIDPFPPPPVPDVDWPAHSVILVAMGRQPTRPCSVDIQSMMVVGDEVIVSVVYTLPGELSIQSFCSPWQMVSISKTDLPTVSSMRVDVTNLQE